MSKANKMSEFENTPEAKRRRKKPQIQDLSHSSVVEINPSIGYPHLLLHSRRSLHPFENSTNLQSLLGQSCDFNILSISFGGQDHFKSPRIVKGDFSLQQYARKSLTENISRSRQKFTNIFLQKQQKRIVKLKKREVSENLLLDRFPNEDQTQNQIDLD